MRLREEPRHPSARIQFLDRFPRRLDPATVLIIVGDDDDLMTSPDEVPEVLDLGGGGSRATDPDRGDPGGGEGKMIEEPLDQENNLIPEGISYHERFTAQRHFL